MKKIFSLGAGICLYASHLLCQPANFHYASGRLDQDPKTSQFINSPYLEFSRNGKQQWIAYDPSVSEGRFVSVASSFTGGIACGYIKGTFNFLGKTVEADADSYNGVIASVSPNQQLQWLYAHESDLAHSTFTSVVKRRDGNAIVSGYAYDKSDRQALLICFDRKGKKLWEKKLNDAEGYQLLISKNDEVRWMILKKMKGQSQSEIHHIDAQSGESLHKITEQGNVEAEGLRGSMAMTDSDFGSVITARLTDNLAINKYDGQGQSLWQSAVSYGANSGGALELTGVVQRPNGMLQLSLNLTDEVKIEGQSLAPLYDGDTDLLLITLSENGKYIGHEQYGGHVTRVNSIFKSGDQIGIVGSYRSNLWIQDSLLVSENDLDKTYLVYLQDYETSKLLVKTDADSIALEHLGGLSVFPNPVAYQQLSIQKENIAPEQSYAIHIYNSSGQLQMTMGVVPATPLIQETMDVSGLTSGLYHVFLYQNQQLISSGKFIIQR